MKNAALACKAVSRRRSRSIIVGRVPLLRAVAKAAKNPDEQLAYQQASCRQPDRRCPHRPLSPRQESHRCRSIAGGGKLGSYAAYNLIDAEFAISNDAADANVLANQKKWMSRPGGFPREIPELRRSPGGFAPSGERQRVQRRGEEGAGAIREARQGLRQLPMPARKRPVHSAGWTWSASRSPSREPDCKTSRSTRRSIAASRCCRVLGELEWSQ